jgi:hypothetical protein
MMERPETQPYATPGHTGQDRDTTDAMREEGEELRDEAAREARSVAATVGEQTSVVIEEATSHARDLAEDAKQQLHRQATSQTEQLGGVIGQLGDRVHALAEGRPDDAGPVGQYADRIADQVDQLAGRIDRLGFDGMVDELQHFARRRPGAFLAGAALAGFAVSRMGRGVQAAQQDEQQGDGRGTGQPALPGAAGAPPLVTAPPPTVTAPNVPPAPTVPPTPAVPPTPGAPSGGLSGEPLFEGSPTDAPVDDPTIGGPEAAPPPPTANPDPLRSGQVRP